MDVSDGLRYPLEDNLVELIRALLPPLTLSTHIFQLTGNLILNERDGREKEKLGSTCSSLGGLHLDW